MSNTWIAPSEWENIYKEVVNIVEDNSYNITMLLDTINPVFGDDWFNITSQIWFSYYTENVSSIRGLPTVWEATNNNIRKTAEVTFNAWYTKIVILAFYAICVTKIKKYASQANESLSNWYFDLDSDASDIMKFMLGGEVSGDNFVLIISRFSSNRLHQEDHINISIDTPKVFENRSISDINTLPVKLALDLDAYTPGHSHRAWEDIPLNDVGKIIKEYYLDNLKSSLKI